MSETSEPQGRDGARERRVRLADGTEVALATWARRAVARIIDIAIVAGLMLVAFVAGFAAIVAQQIQSNQFGHDPEWDWYLVYGFAAGHLVIMLYEVLAVALRGRTLGKSKTGIMVVSTSGGRVSLGRSALRWFVPAAVSWLGVAALLWALEPSSQHAWEWPMSLMVYQVIIGAPAVWLLLFVAALRDGHRRGVHDLAAGTIVVAERSASGQR